MPRKCCPIHVYAVHRCTPECELLRPEWEDICLGYRRLWHDRGHTKPRHVSSVQRRCERCWKLFSPKLNVQRFCTPLCQKSMQQMRLADKRRAA